MARLPQSEAAMPIGGFLPENDSSTQLAPATENERIKNQKNNDDGQNSSASDDEGINVIKPLTISTSDTDEVVQLPEFEENMGLSKVELMAFVDDPYWKRLRLLLFVVFWIFWFGMVIAAVVILALSPKCPPIPKLEWWQKTPMYRVEPRTFFDANGDGVGDLLGVANKLDYIQSINIKGIILGDIFVQSSAGPSSQAKVEDFREISPDLGTLSIFSSLVRAAHNRGLFVVLDVNPTTTSQHHLWFDASRKSASSWRSVATDFYRDFYVWEGEENQKTPPAQWKWSNGKTAWAKDEVRGQWYLHNGDPSQPVLNLGNEAVALEVVAFLDYWLERGVDGFSINGLEQLAYLQNGPIANTLEQNLDAGHVKKLLESWRKILESHRERNHRYRVLMLDATDSATPVMDFSSLVSPETADVVLQKDIIAKMLDFPADSDNCDSRCMKNAIDASHEADLIGETGKWRATFVGGPGVPRFASRMGHDLFNAYQLILELLPGTPCLFYGDEIGMLDGKNGTSITPMQWSPNANAGFTTSKKGPFIPLAPKHSTYNVLVQKSLGTDQKQLDVFTKVMKLRQEPSIIWGRIFESKMDSHIYSYLRQAEGFPGFLVAANIGTAPSLIDFMKPSIRLPAAGKVVLTTQNFRHNEFATETKLRLDKVYLRPGEGVVIRLDENIAEDEVVVNGH